MDFSKLSKNLTTLTLFLLLVWILLFALALPVIAPDSATTLPGTAVTIPVLANGVETAGQVLTLTGVTQESNGAVTSESASTVIYTPEADTLGMDG